MKVRLDAATRDGFGTCATKAPEVVELDERGYAALIANAPVPDGEQARTRRAIADRPVHAVVVDE